MSASIRPFVKVAGITAALLVAALVAAPAPASAQAGDVGIQGASYSGVSHPPTSDKPQSKLWWNDGSWWADLWIPSAGWHIGRWDRPTRTWVDTGVANDTRSTSLADVLWDGTHLFIASHSVTLSSDTSPSPSVAGRPALLYRYSYSNGRYSLDAGFPSTINNNSSESLTIDQDSTGALWATWTQVSQDALGAWTNTVYVNASTPGGATWRAPFVIPAAQVHPAVDDISSVVAFGSNKIGVMWSDQLTGTVYWAVRTDGTDPVATSSWHDSAARRGPGFVDDHLNLKSLQSDPAGRVYAAVKTSLNDISSDKTNAQLVLLVYKPGTGSFTESTIATVGDCVTRPQVVLDAGHQVVHVLDTAPASSVSGCPYSGVAGSIYDKTASMDNPVFATGRGTLVMEDTASPNLNDVTSSKQAVTGATGIVLLASNNVTKRYWTADLSLGSSAPVASFRASPTSGQAPLAVAFTDTSTGAPTSWAWTFGDGTSSTSQNPTHTYQAAGSYTARLTATNASGSTAATATVTASSTPPAPGAITFKDATDAANTTATTLVLPSPGAAAAGDVLLAAITVRGSPTITAPAGWTLVKDQANATSARTATYWHLATSNEPASYTFTFAKAQAAAGTVLDYAGVSTTDPIDDVAAAVNTTSSKTLTAPSVTTTTDGDQLVAIYSTANATTISPPTGSTERADRNTGSTTYKATIEAADRAQAAAGATGTQSATAAASGTAVTQLIALRAG